MVHIDGGTGEGNQSSLNVAETFECDGTSLFKGPITINGTTFTVINSSTTFNGSTNNINIATTGETTITNADLSTKINGQSLKQLNGSTVTLNATQSGITITGIPVSITGTGSSLSSSSLSTSGALNVTGVSNLTGKLTTTGNAEIGGVLTCDTSLGVTGTSTFGSATTHTNGIKTDTIDFNASGSSTTTFPHNVAVTGTTNFTAITTHTGGIKADTISSNVSGTNTTTFPQNVTITGNLNSAGLGSSTGRSTFSTSNGLPPVYIIPQTQTMANGASKSWYCFQWSFLTNYPFFYKAVWLAYINSVFYYYEGYVAANTTAVTLIEVAKNVPAGVTFSAQYHSGSNGYDFIVTNNSGYTAYTSFSGFQFST